VSADTYRVAHATGTVSGYGDQVRDVITEAAVAAAPPTSAAPRVLAAICALPEYCWDQAELTEALADYIGLEGPRRRLLQRLHRNTGIKTRRLALPPEEYPGLTDFGTANDAFISAACGLAITAIRQALSAAAIEPEQVDLIVAASSTGLSVPSLDARIAVELGLRQDIRRLPLVGLGCAAGAGGVARLADLLRGSPGQIGVLVTVELCSLTMQRGDTSTAALIASGLFGDGAAAVVMTGTEGDAVALADGEATRLPAVVASRSRLYPHTERAMGWDVETSGLHIVLGPEIPELVRTHLADDVDGFLADQGLSRDAIGWWVCHPGGPKVLEAIQDSLGLQHDDLGVTWESLARIGNISSSSVLHVLSETYQQRRPELGSYGLMMALGPGFSLEMVLLQA
jgi:alkylresorcinol/alkylpyrone synthase